VEFEDLKKRWVAEITMLWCLELRAGGPLTESQIATVNKLVARVWDALLKAWLAGVQYTAGETLEALLQDKSDEATLRVFRFFKI